MPANVDPHSFGFLVTDLARLLRADFDSSVAEAGIGVTPGEARTLAHVARSGPLRQTTLADFMGVEAMTVTGFIDRLEAKHLVQRLPDPDDRRAKLVQTTEAANDVLRAIRQLSQGASRVASAGMSRDEWAHFLRTLRAARDNLIETRANRNKPDAAA